MIKQHHSIEELEDLARRIRGKVIRLSHTSGTSHLGSCLSCVDILVGAYWRALAVDPARPDDPDRDRFILSKGHAAAALYCVLCERKFFPDSFLQNFGQPGCRLEEHPGPNCAPGIEAASGSLGHGLSLGVGMALAARLQKRSYRVLVLLSDGECNEGSVWEAAMFAASHRLSSLCVVVDFNKWQATGRSCEVMALEPLADKFKSFGFRIREVDGHNMAEVADALCLEPDSKSRPSAVIAHTIKGRGVSFMEDDNNWHYRIPNGDEVQKAFCELGLV